MSVVSTVFQSALHAAKRAPGGEVIAQGVWFARYSRDLARARLARYSSSTRDVLSRVRKSGFAVIEGYWPRERCEAAVREIDACIEKFPEAVQHAEDDRIYGIEHLGELARSFHDDPFSRRLADEYTGAKNVVSFTLANRLRFDGSKKLGSGGSWHRDGFLPELKTLLYLTDCDAENGPFQLYERSHTASATLRDMSSLRLRMLQNRVNDAVETFPSQYAQRRRPVVGRAGALLVFDTRAIHSGTPLRAGSRYAFTNYIHHEGQMTREGLFHFQPVVVGAGPDILRR